MKCTLIAQSIGCLMEQRTDYIEHLQTLGVCQLDDQLDTAVTVDHRKLFHTGLQCGSGHVIITSNMCT